jgi:hypothetical protein
MVLIMNCKIHFANISDIAAVAYISVVNRYSTVTRPLHAYTPLYRDAACYFAISAWARHTHRARPGSLDPPTNAA